MTSSTSFALEIGNVGKIRGARWVLRDITFQLPSRGLFHLKGANGAGKTTLFRIIAGELASSRGTININGSALGYAPNQGRDQLVFVPEVLLPSPWLTAYEYLEFRANLRNIPLDSVATAVSEFDLHSFVSRPMGTLSGGERRRVVLAAALTTHASLLLLDEPTANIDVEHCDQLADRLRREAAHRTVLVASHIDRKGLPEPDGVLTLMDGRLDTAEGITFGSTKKSPQEPP